MKGSRIPVARKNGLVVQETPDEVLVYDLNSNSAHCLNETAALIWQSCDGKNSVEQITRLVEGKTGRSVDDDLVWLAIDQLNDKNLLDSPIEPKFVGQTRREVIKKVGLAAVIALPLVASLTAPKSVLAAASCTCATTPDCTAVPACPATCNGGAGVCQ